MEWKDLVTFGIAVIGAVFGVYHFAKSIASEHVRLVLTARVQVGPGGARAIVLEAVNRSAFTVTITAIGFALDGTDFGFDASLGRDLPQRLEPRAAFTAVAPLSIADETDWFPRVRGVYAGTACGAQLRRPSKWLRSLAKEARSAAEA